MSLFESRSGGGKLFQSLKALTAKLRRPKVTVLVARTCCLMVTIFGSFCFPWWSPSDQWRRPKFSFVELYPSESEDGSPPLRSRAEAQVSGLWTKSPRSWNSLQTLFTDFDCRNDQRLKISHNSPPDSWPVCFTVGAKRYIGGLAPLAHAWHRHY